MENIRNKRWIARGELFFFWEGGKLEFLPVLKNIFQNVVELFL